MVSLSVRLGSVVIMLPLTTRLLSASELGYWYLFTNFYAAIIVLDFGVTSASSRTLAMLLAERRAHPENLENSAQVATFFGSCRSIYKWLGAITFFGLGLVGGWWIWQRTANYSEAESVRHAWILACPVFALAVAGNFGRSLLAATNRVTLYQFLSACAFALQLVVGLVTLLAGWGLRALIVANLTMFAVQAVSLAFAFFKPGELGPRSTWTRGTPRDIRSLLGISAGTFSNNFSSYVVLNASVLIASHFFTMAEVASYGLSLQIVLIAAQASTVWLDVKGPMFAHWFRSDPATLRRVFVQRMRLSIATYVTCIVGATLAGPPLLKSVGSQTPILGLAFFLPLATMVFLVMHSGQFDAFCMALGHNPFIKPYLISAMCGVILAITLSPSLGLWALILAPLATQLAWNAWWVPGQALQKLGLTPAEYFARLLLWHHRDAT